MFQHVLLIFMLNVQSVTKFLPLCKLTKMWDVLIPAVRIRNNGAASFFYEIEYAAAITQCVCVYTTCCISTQQLISFSKQCLCK